MFLTAVVDTVKQCFDQFDPPRMMVGGFRPIRRAHLFKTVQDLAARFDRPYQIPAFGAEVHERHLHLVVKVVPRRKHDGARLA